MPSIAVTVVGHDRPGIVHRVTAAIADLAGNLEDSSMSLLRGHFAMTLIASVPDGDSIGRLDDALGDLRSDGLTVAVFEVADQEAPAPGVPARLSVHGADRPGIVRAATEQVMRHGGNITDLSTRLGADLYVLSADVTFPPGSDVAAIGAAVREELSAVGVVATVSPVDEDLL